MNFVPPGRWAETGPTAEKSHEKACFGLSGDRRWRWPLSRGCAPSTRSREAHWRVAYFRVNLVLARLSPRGGAVAGAPAACGLMACTPAAFRRAAGACATAAHIRLPLTSSRAGLARAGSGSRRAAPVAAIVPSHLSHLFFNQSRRGVEARRPVEDQIHA